jgi:tripartite-type tricarboxylate transporter receptor subunit TctC
MMAASGAGASRTQKVRPGPRWAGRWTGVALASLVATSAAAQEYPARPITIMVAFAAGGYADNFARILGNRLSEKLGQSVVIENRGGAGGNIAGAAVAHAQPDGYTLLVTTASIALNETYYKNKAFSASELKAIAIPAGAPETLSVKPDDPAKTLGEIVDAGRTTPFDFASAGVGTSSHVAAAYFFKMLAKIDAVHVPFQGGAPAVNAVLGGHVRVLVGTLPGFVAQMQSGTLRGLAVASEKRVSDVPSMPTYGEGGYPFVAETWVGVFAPARLDDAIATKLNAVVNDIVHEPETEKRLNTFSMQTRMRSLTDSETYFRDEVAKWGKMVDALGLVAK